MIRVCLDHISADVHPRMSRLTAGPGGLIDNDGEGAPSGSTIPPLLCHTMTSARILVVRDRDSDDDALEACLQELGHTLCAPVSSMEQALEKAVETRPDLALIDLGPRRRPGRRRGRSTHRKTAGHSGGLSRRRHRRDPVAASPGRPSLRLRAEAVRETATAPEHPDGPFPAREGTRPSRGPKQTGPDHRWTAKPGSPPGSGLRQHRRRSHRRRRERRNPGVQRRRRTDVRFRQAGRGEGSTVSHIRRLPAGSRHAVSARRLSAHARRRRPVHGRRRDVRARSGHVGRAPRPCRRTAHPGRWARGRGHRVPRRHP